MPGVNKIGFRFRCACSMAALKRAPSLLPSFLFALVLLVVHVAVSLIQYDQQTLLDIRSLMEIISKHC